MSRALPRTTSNGRRQTGNGGGGTLHDRPCGYGRHTRTCGTPPDQEATSALVGAPPPSKTGVSAAGERPSERPSIICLRFWGHDQSGDSQGRRSSSWNIGTTSGDTTRLPKGNPRMRIKPVRLCPIAGATMTRTMRWSMNVHLFFLDKHEYHQQRKHRFTPLPFGRRTRAHYSSNSGARTKRPVRPT